ncbi:hypothetical protein CFP65_6226 [Kitasatospora sp. MMS16-BH015]|uniref:hypothetical protein n=1 Tax=Kitasatospora sp. MMS16-BH015 TaxID=2018025 RepID=UPI000CA10BBA|nr:hypothetical protein [Kitasatospora sp. MMS16-BH015]AUG80891.1 hypothetical protein CFP65_6226 [Kitasatospora sp. MMS16-BH015]
MPATTSDGITYATSREEAEQLLLAFCERIQFDRAWITDAVWSTTLDVACSKKTGLDSAEKAIVADKNEKTAKAAKEARKLKISAKRDEILAEIEAFDNTDLQFDEDAVQLFRQATNQYIGGGQLNFTYGTDLTAADYASVRKSWTEIGKIAAELAPNLFFNLTSLKPEDKEAKGKGQVGDTLDTRKVQGNLFIGVVSMKFNIHVNIK